MANCCPGISILKTAVGSCESKTALSAMFIAKLVFPIDGRPAMTIKSDFCNPEVKLSRSLNPVEMPVNEFPDS